MTLSSYGLLVITIHNLLGVQATITSPGIIKTEVGLTTDIQWTLSEQFDTSLGNFLVYKGYINENDQIISFVGTYSGKCALYVPNVACLAESYQVGFNIRNIHQSNASRYSIKVQYSPVDPWETDQVAVLYIYETPAVPSVNGNIGQEGWTYNLTCYAESQSLPEEFRNQSTIQYTWSGDYNGIGSSITIGPLYREDNGKTVTCTAKDQGASDRLTSERSVNIIVYYSPGSVTLSTNSTLGVERNKGVNLTCILPDDQHGNPNVYSYYWMDPATKQWTNYSQSSLIISSEIINATLHEGEWQCKMGNLAGNSTTGSVTIVVNAIPTVMEQPQDTAILVNQTLSVTCSFMAKPTTNITWIRAETDVPDNNVINITQSNTENGLYIITTSTMSWKTEDISKRITVSDNYTCQGINSVEMDLSQTMELDIYYWPISISFIGPGDTSERAEVIENTEIINRTCNSDCNPDCSYIWINNTEDKVISDRPMLDLQTPDRYDTGNYTCIASNIYGKMSIIFSLNVKYSPTISVTTSNTSNIIERDNVTLHCDVSSNPLSDIKLYNMTDNKTLDTVKIDNKAEYQFINTNCLDTGQYMFTAKNNIPDMSYTEDEKVYIDVMCSPRKISQSPDTGVEGVPLGSNYTLEVGILSNPYPTITCQSWTFIDYNGTLHDTLPDNVYTWLQEGDGRLTLIAMLTIIETENSNYGNYTLKTGNVYGNMTPVTFGVVPRGPPFPPSVPRLVDITALSITINWTAGFNGGLQQTFTVLYKDETTDVEYTSEVDTDPEVNKGDVIVYKLMNNIQSNTTYNVRIQAENDFNGGSTVHGESEMFTTLVKATFISDPEITLVEDKAEIHFTISGPLTHIIEENCVMDTNICDKVNITVPNSKQIKLSKSTDIHDFTVEVPLADPEATKFVFYFWMYDGDDLLYAEANAIPVDRSKAANVGLIVGVVVGVVLAAVIIVTVVVLWKREIIPRKNVDKTSQTTPEEANGGFVNPAMSAVDDRQTVQRHEVGPISGEPYAVVTKQGNKNIGNKPKPSTKPKVLQVYENVPLSGASATLQRTLPFSLVGVDGTAYADLEIIGKPSETGIIHGQENKVEYTDINYIKYGKK